ncbi:DUF5930 domain-containing protein [Halovulum sp. GXIMD14793]
MNDKSDLSDQSQLHGRTITISAKGHTRQIHLSPLRQALWATGALCIVGWTTISSAFFVMSMVNPVNDGASTNALHEAYQARIATLASERDSESAAAIEARARFQKSLDQITALQGDLHTSLRDRQELRASINALRDQLVVATLERNEATAESTELASAIDDMADSVEKVREAGELADTLNVISTTLGSTARERDEALQEMAVMETQIASLELSMQINAERQERMIAELEDAVEMSFKPLEAMFERSGLDVNTLVSAVQPTSVGQGGPLTPLTMGTKGFDPELSTRFGSVVKGMDRMNSMRIAASKIPFTMPVRSAHRFTSSFGGRRDPITGGIRSHNGIDLAAGRGTPIYSTADGVVVFASRQRGYGNQIKIRHQFGFETVYAHLNKIHVKVGDRIARGDHIGDMGNTGRSTGVHLHYEVRLSGKPVNPMTYIKAARDVF